MIAITGNTYPVRSELRAMGFVFGDFDGFVGTRVYPAWQGAFDSKRLVCRDIRLLEDGTLIVHNPWTNVIEDRIESVAAIGEYLKTHGRVCEGGANVWD
jgi:hypothetical protein